MGLPERLIASLRFRTTDSCVPMSADGHISDPIASLAATAPERVLLCASVSADASGEDIGAAPATLSWTSKVLDRWIQRIEHKLLSAGLAPGAPVAVFAPRRPATVALLWAIWRTGGIAVPLNTRQPAGSAVNQAERAGARLLVSSDAEVAKKAMEAGTPAARFDAFTEPPSGASAGADDASAGSSIRASAGGGAAFPEEGSLRASLLPLDARATAVFTSGSTGTPKLAVHTLGNHVYSARGSAENIPVSAASRWLASLPFYHVGGLAIVFRCALAGATLAVPSQGMGLLSAIRVLRPTHVSMVATQLKRLLSTPSVRDDLQSIEAILLGGSAIPPALLDDAYARGWPVHISYGSTEMASQVTATPPNPSRETLATSGRCLPYRVISIQAGGDGKGGDGKGEEESVGEIYVGGKPLFAGYATSNAADGPLDAARTAEGLFATGDLGSIDDAGRLHVTGRADRLIVSGGENIQPEEVEAALERCEGILFAAVVGVPDAEFGERPVAFVEWEGEERNLDAELRNKLPGYKLPDAIHPMPREAIHASLKVDYKILESTARKLPN